MNGAGGSGYVRETLMKSEKLRANGRVRHEYIRVSLMFAIEF